MLFCLVAKLCSTPLQGSGLYPTASSVHEIPQARILEWVAMPSSGGYSQLRDQTQVSRITGGFFTSGATRETHEYRSG